MAIPITIHPSGERMQIPTNANDLTIDQKLGLVMAYGRNQRIKVITGRSMEYWEKIDPVFAHITLSRIDEYIMSDLIQS